MKKISVIVSCYNEEESIPLFYNELYNVMDEMDYVDFEVLFVDDGSKDKTLEKIKELQENDRRIKYISFSRNFGKEAAMYAGLSNAKGDFITLMDADLQDPPKLLKEMYDLIINEDYDQVGTRRITRSGEPKLRSFFARIFYRIINKMTKRVEIVDGARDYRLMKRSVVDAILSMSEYERFSKGIFSFVGFKTKWIEFKNVNRVAGKTKWSFKSLFWYAIDGIIGFTTEPLKLPLYFGLLLMFISFVMFVIMIINLFSMSIIFNLITLILFLFSVLFIFIGIIGMYLAKTYLETKKRPIYIVKETNIKRG